MWYAHDIPSRKSFAALYRCFEERRYTPPPLPDPDDTYDRFIEMSIVTGDSLVTAEDMQEFSDYIGSNEDGAAGSDIPF